MKPYRAWVNQPSILQSHHHLHGKRCIVTEEDGEYVTIFFTEGELIATNVHHNVICKLQDAGKLVTADHPR